MNRILLIATLLIASSFQFCLNSFAQDGGRAILKGRVIDAVTGEPLIGTNIAIQGTSIGTATDLNGEYMLPNIPAGTHTVLFRYIGYKKIDQSSVQLKPGETIELNIEMSAESIMGEEAVVTVQARGQLAAINQERASNSISNIVASDRIREVPDANAAESIGRLPGVSLKRSGGEGNRIVVRGLSPQYTIVEIDGVRLSGVDGDRGVGLSTISSEMLDGIELFKTLTPDKDADAIGGIVNLRTRVAAEGFHFNLLGSGGYSSLETSFNNYRMSGNVSNRFFDNKLGVLLNLSQEQVNRSSDIFSAGYIKNIAESDDLYTTNAVLTERKTTRHRKHGSLVLDYKTDFMKIKFNNIYSQMVDENEQRDNIFRFNLNDFIFNISDSKPIETIQSHSLNGLFNILTTELNVSLAYSKTNLELESDLYGFEDNYVLEGSSISENEKLFAMPGDLIDKYFDISSIDRSTLQHNTRQVILRDDVTKTLDLDWKVPYSLGGKLSGYIKFGGQYSKKERSADTESHQTIFWGGIGVGRARDIYDIYFPDFLRPEDVGITNADGIVGKNFEDPDYDYGDFLDGRYTLGWSADMDYTQFVFDSIYRTQNDLVQYHPSLGVASNRDDFVTTEEKMAGYVMAEIKIGRRIMLLPGVRYETMQTEYSSKYVLEDPFAPTGVKTGYPKDVAASRENANWFPSINMKFEMNEWLDIRGAYYKSTSRPDYSLLSPSMVANNDKTSLISYNPYLWPSLAHNFDIGVSFFTNKLGLLTINAFYKEISDLIYRLPAYQPQYFENLEGAPESLMESLEAPRHLYDEDLYLTSGTSNNNYPINNPNKAYFRGFEVSWQTNFWYLPGLLSGFVLDLNYSMIWSKTEFPYIDFRREMDTSGFIPIPIDIPLYKTREARMLDQPASLFNARIGWDYKGFSTRLSFRFQGETISSLDPVHSLLDEVRGKMFRMDLTLKQKITKQLSVTVDLANLNQYVDDSYLYALEYIMPRRSEFYGFTAQIAVKYEF